jgi:hypothetical protein
MVKLSNPSATTLSNAKSATCALVAISSWKRRERLNDPVDDVGSDRHVHLAGSGSHGPRTVPSTSHLDCRADQADDRTRQRGGVRIRFDNAIHKT